MSRKPPSLRKYTSDVTQMELSMSEIQIEYVEYLYISFQMELRESRVSDNTWNITGDYSL